MEVPAQCIKSCNEPEYLPEEDLTLLIIGSVLLAIILFVLICFICGICMKKKQQDEKLRRLVSPNGRENFTPSYRNMAFTDNLEGTVDSLQKYKRGPTQTTTAPMMPNLGTNYQVSSISDIRVAKSWIWVGFWNLLSKKNVDPSIMILEKINTHL